MKTRILTMIMAVVTIMAVVAPAQAIVPIGPVLDHCYFEWDEGTAGAATGFNMWIGVVPGGPYALTGQFAAPNPAGPLHYGPTPDQCGGLIDGQKYAVVTGVNLDMTETARSNEVAFCLQHTESIACQPPLPPAPFITALSPTSVVAGTGDFTLVATGTGFVSGASLLYNGVSKITIFDSATQVHAVIPSTDASTAKTVQITVRNPDGQVGNVATFTVVAAPPPPPPPPPSPCPNGYKGKSGKCR